MATLDGPGDSPYEVPRCIAWRRSCPPLTSRARGWPRGPGGHLPPGHRVRRELPLCAAEGALRHTWGCAFVGALASVAPKKGHSFVREFESVCACVHAVGTSVKVLDNGNRGQCASAFAVLCACLLCVARASATGAIHHQSVPLQRGVERQHLPRHPQGQVVARPHRLQSPAIRRLTPLRPQSAYAACAQWPRNGPCMHVCVRVHVCVCVCVWSDDPLVGSIAQELLHERPKHDKKAREWTKRCVA